MGFPDRSRNSLFKKTPITKVLKGIDFEISKGESVGIVGESGSGKTTLGRCLIRLLQPTGGQLLFDGTDITTYDATALRALRPRMQMIFQDPLSALNPRHRIGHIVGQPLTVKGSGQVSRPKSKLAPLRKKALLAMQRAGLGPEFFDRYPHQLSGGQRQRVGIARAIVSEPEFILADEVVSGLDVSTQAQILLQLRNLKQEMGLALAFISHDLSVVRVLCDRLIVLYQGEIVEQGSCSDIFENPQHPYTRKLISAVPLPEIDEGWLTREAAF